MCLAVPFIVISIAGKNAKVEYKGVKLTVDIRLLTNLKPGDYVLVHAGFAIQKMETGTAEEIVSIFEGLGKNEK